MSMHFLFIPDIVWLIISAPAQFRLLTIANVEAFNAQCGFAAKFLINIDFTKWSFLLCRGDAARARRKKLAKVGSKEKWQ